MRGVVLIAALALAGSAIAEPFTGSRIDDKPMAPKTGDDVGPGAATRVMIGLGRCAAYRHPRPVKAALALPFADPAQDEAVGKLFSYGDECMGSAVGRLSFKSILIVGAMAEQLMEDRRPRIDLATALSSAVPATPRNGMEDFGDCMVGRDPAAVVALLRSRPTSPDENAKMSALKPALGLCLPANQTFKLSYAMVRSLVAVGAYRRLSAAPQAPH
jgi:hypothetical protein